MNNLNKLLNFLEKRCFLIISIIMAFTIWLNWGGTGMLGQMDNYELYRQTISSGFKSGNTNTFPMWGYGWVMAISTSKLFLLLLQSALAIFSLYQFVQVLTRYSLVSLNVLKWLKLSLIIALPLYTVHALRWANSFNVSLFLLAFTFLMTATKEGKWMFFALSGVLFGLALNFRSEFYLMPLGYVVIMAIFYQGKQKYLHLGVWLITIYAMLIPWSIYTKNVTGHRLITSTNSGHVCFIGLGNNPNNKWGILEHDNDPVMQKLLDERFGTSTSSLVYESDQFLKKEFMNRVKEDPAEYVVKCIWSLKKFMTQGTYPGEFIDAKSFIGKLTGKPAPVGTDDSDITEFGLLPGLFISGIQIYSALFGKLLVLISILLLPIGIRQAIKRKDLFYTLVIASILYQVTINVLCYQMASYTSNIILFLIVNLLIGIEIIQAYYSERRNSNKMT